MTLSSNPQGRVPDPFPHPLQSPNPSVAHTLQPQVEVERSRSGRRSSRSGERAMLVPHCLRSGCRQWIVLATNIKTLHNLYVDIRGCEVLHPGGYRSAKLLNTSDEILREEVAVWGRNPCEELKIAQLERKGLEARELENVVIDPTRTVSSGKMEIGAFMAYSKDYKTPDDKCSYQTISLRKSEKFGIPWKQVPPAEKSYLSGHRKSLSFQKPLQSVLSRRSFSTETDGDDGFNAQISDADLIDTKGFDEVAFGDSGLWMQNVEIEANNFNRELAVDSLKAEFERDFRPLLAFHCLMLPHSVDHYTTAYFHGPAHGSTNLRTLYLSSLDVMVRMRTLKKWQRKFLLDHIIQRRILIVDDWEHSYANIEMLEYDFGTSNADSVRGECDASFQVDKLNQGGVGKACGSIIHSGKSKLAIIIWKGRRVLWAGIYEGIPCNDSHHAEVQAALALLMKCEEMKFSSVELWSDSRRACGVINGSETIQMNDTNRDTCLLLQSMRKRFTKVVAIQKPRELMFLADGLLRSDWYPGSFFKKAMGSWAPYLRGCPLFKVTNNHTTSKIIKSFEQTRTNKERRGYTYSPETTFYWKVKKDRKLEELERLREFLEPACMLLVVEAFEEEPLLLREHLAVLYPESESHAGITTLKDCIVVDPRQRTLVVVWNASIPRAKYYRQDSCTIIMVDDEEVKEMKRLRINEINIETYLYFHRREYKPGA